MGLRVLTQTLLVALELFPADISRVRIGQQYIPLLLWKSAHMDSALRVFAGASAASAEYTSVTRIV